jgi:hypothetical protein
MGALYKGDEIPDHVDDEMLKDWHRRGLIITKENLDAQEKARLAKEKAKKDALIR